MFRPVSPFSGETAWPGEFSTVTTSPTSESPKNRSPFVSPAAPCASAQPTQP